MNNAYIYLCICVFILIYYAVLIKHKHTQSQFGNVDIAKPVTTINAGNAIEMGMVLDIF